MGVIYEPKGAAREYSELAVNLYAGCMHGCRYCYVPGVLRKTRAEFHASARPRPGILEQLAREAPAYAGDPREVLLSFTSDPYQSCEEQHRLTRRALEILVGNGVKVAILTKRPQLAVQRDMDLLLQGRVRLGTTAVFDNIDDCQAWEPGAAWSAPRLSALAVARARGLQTWLSLEPVVFPKQALNLIRFQKGNPVDEIRIGKLNHFQPGPLGDGLEVPRVDWSQFVTDATALCREQGQRFMLKQSLAGYL